jgi:hypothetical protein
MFAHVARQRRQLRIESGNARPVGITGSTRLGVAGDNGGLEGIKTARSAQLARASLQAKKAIDAHVLGQLQ